MLRSNSKEIACETTKQSKQQLPQTIIAETSSIYSFQNL